MKNLVSKLVCIAFLTVLCAGNVSSQQFYQLKITFNPLGTGSSHPPSPFPIPAGVDYTVSAYPFNGYTFANWTEDGIVVSTDSDYTFFTDGDKDLVANLAPNPYEVTLLANPPEGGEVFGGGVYLFGEEVTVRAVPSPGNKFVDWTRRYVTASGVVIFYQVSAEPEYTFTSYRHDTLIANFVPKEIEIRLSKNIEEGGTLTGDGIYPYGWTVVVGADYNLPEYEFDNWTEDGVVVSNRWIYSFKATHSRHLVANFKTAAYELKLYANPEEGGTVTGKGIYNYGDHVTVTAKANPEYEFLNWTRYISGNGTVVSTDPVYSFEITGEGWGSSALVAYFTTDVEVEVLVNIPEGEVLGGGTYKLWDEVTVEAIPKPGYKFVNWSEARSIISTDNPYSFVVTGSRVLVANLEHSVGIDPIETGAMTIYPNPTNSEMTVVLNNPDLTIIEMELYDLAGKKVLQQTVNQPQGTLKLDGLAQGVYILKAFLNQGDVVVCRVVKQ